MNTRLYDVEEDFEARITILTEAQGGRKTPPVNGIRWDFLYAQDDPADGIFMIWPDFCDADGTSFSTDTQLKGTLHARMHIARKEGIATHHQGKLQEGTEFYCVEGPKKVAKGVVTKLTGIEKHFSE